MPNLFRFIAIASAMALGIEAHTKNHDDYLVRLKPGFQSFSLDKELGVQSQPLSLKNWLRVQAPKGFQGNALEILQASGQVDYVQPNYKIKIPSLNFDTQLKELIAQKGLNKPSWKPMAQDNPEIPAPTQQGRGADPLLNKQWGMRDIGVKDAWSKTRGSEEIVVAVIDTGVDYTHEDLLPNLWRNPGEIAGNGVDDDGNGYIDDVIGWDFASDDNKPYDLYYTELSDIFNGGNPGHGTHCAGNVAAAGNNAKGISGVAPNVKIMSIRFITDRGSGTTADAIEAINYAVKNGAQILSNSWGSVGEEPGNPENEALRQAIREGQKAGSLFVFAAGNGKQGRGYDNDTDSQPAYPASYDIDTIVSVAALDSSNKLGTFSNWGRRTVDIGAPGVKVFSTVPGQRYDDVVIDFFGRKITWDGTSMAAPHVAGAAALYWSKHPNKTWKEVKQALIDTVVPISALNGKSVSGGKLNVKNLLAR